MANRAENEPMTLEDFAAKVDWEGGVIDAIDYGLKPEDAPEGELRDLWRQACDLFKQMEPITNRIGELLEEAQSRL